MAGGERELRDTVERLQAELRAAKDELTRSRAEMARLELLSTREKHGRVRAEAERAAADAKARDADAAFQHALSQLERARKELKSSSAAPSTAARNRSGPLANDGIRPDDTEQKIRFAVGAVAGGFFGFYFAARLGLVSGVLTLGVIVGSALVGGVLSWWYGDRYWTR
jgi:chromosome segregation ATPase